MVEGGQAGRGDAGQIDAQNSAVPTDPPNDPPAGLVARSKPMMSGAAVGDSSASGDNPATSDHESHSKRSITQNVVSLSDDYRAQSEEPASDEPRLIPMRRVLPLIVLLVAFLAFAGPAYGCSCAMLEPAELLEFSPVAFVGTITGAVPVVQRNMGDAHAISFEVDTVLAGQVPTQVEVVTAGNSAACGIDAVVGTRLAVFAADDGDQLTSNVCSTADPDTAIKALGPGTAPTGEGQLADAGLFDWQALGLATGGLAIVGAAWWLSRRR